MAYMNQERKAKISAALKPILKQYGLKGTLSVRNGSTIVLTVKSGKIDFIGNCNKTCGNDHYQMSHGFRPITGGYTDVNPYHFQNHFSGRAKAFLTAAFKALKSADWYDRSDAMTDYFDTAYYTTIQIGKWDKPYIVEA